MNEYSLAKVQYLILLKTIRLSNKTEYLHYSQQSDIKLIISKKSQTGLVNYWKKRSA